MRQLIPRGEARTYAILLTITIAAALLLYNSLNNATEKFIEADVNAQASNIATSLAWKLPAKANYTRQDISTDIAYFISIANQTNQNGILSLYNAEGEEVVSAHSPGENGVYTIPVGSSPPMEGLKSALNGVGWTHILQSSSDQGAIKLAHIFEPILRKDVVVGVIYNARLVTDRWLATDVYIQQIILIALVAMICFILSLMVLSRRRLAERKEAENKANYFARYDTLTNLPNRLYFEELLEQAFARSRRQATKFCVIVVNIDRFREINDVFGHAVGDELLKKMSEQLVKAVRYSDRVCRIGNDEFIILTDEISSAQQMISLINCIDDAARRNLDVGRHKMNNSVTMGVAVAPDNGANSENIITAGRLALHRAKEKGRGSFRFFEPEMDKVVRKRRELKEDLRLALVENQLKVFYQPQFDLETMELTGFEALMRWKHPVEGYISPAIFIPVAEEENLIPELGEWILRQACKDAAKWKGKYCVAVNISPAQFIVQDIAALTASALDEANLDSSRLELEITESILMTSTEKVRHTLHKIQAMGIKIAMDDFGTGYSSLATLSQIPFSKLKIDRSFVMRLGRDEGNDIIVQMIVGLGESLGVQILAEGIETDEQLDYLREYGCNSGQGYYYGKPVPQSEVLEVLGELNKNSADSSLISRIFGRSRAA